jgi:hypothetical protein
MRPAELLSAKICLFDEHYEIKQFGQLFQENPLPTALKLSLLEELLGPQVAQLALAAGGVAAGLSRPLTLHERATLDAITGRARDIGNRELLKSIRQTRGSEIMAWAELANMATQLRVGATA